MPCLSVPSLALVVGRVITAGLLLYRRSVLYRGRSCLVSHVSIGAHGTVALHDSTVQYNRFVSFLRKVQGFPLLLYQDVT